MLESHRSLRPQDSILETVRSNFPSQRHSVQHQLCFTLCPEYYKVNGMSTDVAISAKRFALTSNVEFPLLLTTFVDYFGTCHSYAVVFPLCYTWRDSTQTGQLPGMNAQDSPWNLKRSFTQTKRQKATSAPSTIYHNHLQPMTRFVHINSATRAPKVRALHLVRFRIICAGISILPSPEYSSTNG